jgi:hypothetical protein
MKAFIDAIWLHFGCTQVCERLPSPNGESLVNCNSLESMPNIAFTISGKEFVLTPQDVSDSPFPFSNNPFD